jgi:hypothetical protein
VADNSRSGALGYISLSTVVIFVLGIYVGITRGIWWPIIIFGFIPLGWIIFTVTKGDSRDR